MAVDYTAIAADTLQALAEAGAAATLTTPGAATYDPATGTASATPTDYSAFAVLLPAGSMKGAGLVFAQDVTQRAQAWALVAASGLAATPTPGCILTIAGTRYTVIGADTLRPNGSTAVLHGLALVIG